MTSKDVKEIGLFVNIGQRDLQIDGKPLEAEQLRDRALAIAKDFATMKNRITAPMLEAALTYIQNMHGAVAYRPLVLFATDQADPAHREKDTIECANVIKRWLAERPGPKLQDRVEVVRVVEQPNLYDSMFSEYQPHMSRYATKCSGDVYFLCAGGTPACNTALLLAGTIAFRERAHVLTVNPGGSAALPLAFGRQILETFRRSKLQQLLDRRDFDGAAANVDNGENVRRLAEAASARMNFDFARSFSLLSELRQNLDPPPAGLTELWEEGSRLTNNVEAEVLRDLYWNAKLKWDRGEYADFLGRVWRLREASLYREVGRLCGRSLEKDGSEVLKRWIEEKSQGGLRDHLAKSNIKIEMNNKVLQSILEFFASSGAGIGVEDQARLKAIHRTIQFFQKASALRNNCVIAHGYEGLSRDRILEELGIPGSEDVMFERLREMMMVQGVKVGDDPFKRFADLIMEVDKRG